MIRSLEISLGFLDSVSAQNICVKASSLPKRIGCPSCEELRPINMSAAVNLFGMLSRRRDLTISDMFESILGISIPERRCSHSHVVRRIFPSLSKAPTRANAVPEIQYLPPARGESKTSKLPPFASVCAADFQIAQVTAPSVKYAYSHSIVPGGFEVTS